LSLDVATFDGKTYELKPKTTNGLTPPTNMVLKNGATVNTLIWKGEEEA
jgi:hypothetical protein